MKAILAALLFAAFSAQAAPRAYDITIGSIVLGPGPTSSVPDTGKYALTLKNSSGTVLYGPVQFDKAPTYSAHVMLDAGSYSICVDKQMPSNAVSAQPSGPICGAFSISNDFIIEIVKSIGAPAIVVSPVQP